MKLKEQLDADFKEALLARDKVRVEVLRGLKSAILYAEVASGEREKGLSDEAMIAVLAKEAKKRTESAELYSQAGATDRAKAELAEKAIIDAYLPAQMSDEALAAAVDAVISDMGDDAPLGQIIGHVRQQVGASADGARIAAAVKVKLGQ